MPKCQLAVGFLFAILGFATCATGEEVVGTPPDEIVLHFPPDRSMGSLAVISEPPSRKQIEALGDVRLPRGKKFTLLLARGTTDLSCLQEMTPLGLESLTCNMLDWTDDAIAQVTIKGLKRLYLSAPNLTDDMLAQVAQMETVEDLSISAPLVTCEGLGKLAPLPLKRLSLRQIKMSDECLAAIAPFRELQSLELNCNRFNKDNVSDAGIAQLKDLTNLETLDLSGTKMTDAGLASLAGLTKIESLSLDETDITDDGLKHLAGMRELKSLRISARGISDKGLAYLTHFPRLERLRLASIGSDATWEAIGKLTALRDLSAYVGEVSEEAWAQIEKLQNLESLSVHGDGVNDAAMRHIGCLTTLKTLSIQNARVTDVGLAQLSPLSNLEHLSLYRLPITADGLHSLAALKRLTWLSLGGITDLGTSGLESLAKSTSLEILNLSNDFRIATVTEEQLEHLAALPKLNYLQLSRIEISDRGAQILSRFPALKQVSMDGNHATLTDAGLKSLAQLPELTNLSAGGKFTAAGIEALARAKSLKHLVLYTNSLPEEALAKLGMGQYAKVFPYKPQPVVTPQARAEKFYVAVAAPRARVAQALTDARLGHARVLLAIGSAQNAVGQQLATLLDTDADCQRSLVHYREVGLSSDDPDVSAILREQGVQGEFVVPRLVALDETGELLEERSFAPAEKGGKIDAAAVRAFLQEHSPARLDAQKLLADALTQARVENKRVYLQESGMHCAPCLMMSRFLDQHRSILSPDFIFIKIDCARSQHGDEIMKSIRPGGRGGIPWVAILDADGKVLTTSNDAAGENIGFPSEERSVEHYLQMFATTAQRMTPDQHAELRKWFQDRLAVIRPPKKDAAK